ncbi:MAG: DNA primase [Endomicrobia bacterium]|nr:DNA primase [Endomicrobiia bacterium]
MYLVLSDFHIKYKSITDDFMIKLESIKNLKQSVDIINIVSKYIPNLKKSGKNYFALCPFHSERTPSFSIAPDKNLVHCFGCGYTGDIIKFVQDMENIGYYEAIEKIASFSNFKLEYENLNRSKEIKEKTEEKNLLINVLTDTAEVYHEILLNSDVAAGARNYLISRGLKIDTIKTFKIGFAPDGNYISKNYKTISHFREKNYDLSLLYKAGIVNFRDDKDLRSPVKKYEHPYDYFRNRIIFPIFNFNGKVIGFGGRILPNGVVDKDIPLYINSPETPVFFKSSVLYGFYQAKETIKETKEVFVVEGYMDVVVLHQEGVKSVVAPLGTSLTEKHINLLKRFNLNRVYLFFDPDDAGREATILASKVILKNEEYPYIIMPEEKLDPDEYILKYGKDEFEILKQSSTTLVKYVVESCKRNRNSMEVSDKVNLLKKFNEIINEITNPLIKSEFIKEISNELKINETLVRLEYKKFLSKGDTHSYIEKLVNNRPYSCEEELLRLSIHYPSIINELDENIFSHNEDCLRIFIQLKKKYLINNNINDVLEELDEKLKNLVLRMVFDEIPCMDSLEKKIETLCSEIFIAKCKKRYQVLKDEINEMLAQKKTPNPELFNEFRHIIEILKLQHK